LWTFAAWHKLKDKLEMGCAMVKRERVETEGVPPADSGLAKKYLRPGVSHQRRGWQPQPDDGKARRPPLAPEGSISRLSVAEQLRGSSAEREEH
jgi:hypothetical protein